MREREDFIAKIVRELPDSVSYYRAVTFARTLMRLAKTHGRLAEAQCNGDWPADHGDSWPTVECGECGSHWAREAVSKKTGLCKSCRIEGAITRLCAEYGRKPIFGGDPRGATVKLAKLGEDGITDDWAREGICVPQ